LKERLRTSLGFPSKGYTDDQIRKILRCMNWLELLSEKKVVHQKGNYMDCLCETMQEKMQYEKHESDLIILHHIFGIQWPNGQKETRTSTLAARGDSNSSAMGKTVGLPVAIAAELMLQGVIQKKGVIGPMSPEIYKPIMKSLANEGLRFVERLG